MTNNANNGLQNRNVMGQEQTMNTSTQQTTPLVDANAAASDAGSAAGVAHAPVAPAVGADTQTNPAQEALYADGQTHDISKESQGLSTAKLAAAIVATALLTTLLIILASQLGWIKSSPAGDMPAGNAPSGMSQNQQDRSDNSFDGFGGQGQGGPGGQGQNESGNEKTTSLPSTDDEANTEADGDYRPLSDFDDDEAEEPKAETKEKKETPEGQDTTETKPSKTIYDNSALATVDGEEPNNMGFEIAPDLTISIPTTSSITYPGQEVLLSVGAICVQKATMYEEASDNAELLSKVYKAKSHTEMSESDQTKVSIFLAQKKLGYNALADDIVDAAEELADTDADETAVRYVWTSTDAWLDTTAPQDGSMGLWQDDYYIVHEYYEIGGQVLQIETGDKIMIDGHSILVAGTYLTPKKNTLEGIRSHTGEAAVVIQTCWPNSNKNKITWGYYLD